jgi:hypothetical protein
MTPKSWRAEAAQPGEIKAPAPKKLERGAGRINSRAIADALGVSHDTANRDAGRNEANALRGGHNRTITLNPIDPLLRRSSAGQSTLLSTLWILERSTSGWGGRGFKSRRRIFATGRRRSRRKHPDKNRPPSAGKPRGKGKPNGRNQPPGASGGKRDAAREAKAGKSTMLSIATHSPRKRPYISGMLWSYSSGRGRNWVKVIKQTLPRLSETESIAGRSRLER